MNAGRARPWRRRYGAAVASSLLAEAVFMAMVAAVALVRGTDPWKVVRVPAALVIGPDAVRPPGFVPGDVALGLMMHLGLGVLVGLIYAAVLPRIGVSPVVGGLIAGGVLYALGFLILPLLFPVWLAPFWLPPMGKLLQAAAHAAYGVVFGLAYRRLTR